MPIIVSWDDPEQTIVRWKFSNPWHVSELMTVQDEVFMMIERKPQVDAIAVIPKDLNIPADWISTVRQVQNGTLHQMGDDIGILVFVCESGLWLSLLHLISRLGYAVNWHFASSVPEAHKLIYAQRLQN